MQHQQKPMLKKILIAGAGHGGIMAGSILAQNGFDVIIYEKENKEDLGYPWHDDLILETFQDCGLDFLESHDYHRKDNICFVSPNLKSLLFTNLPKEKREIAIDRKLLYRKLLTYAEQKGVKFRFSHKVIGPILKDDIIIGLKIQKEGEELRIQGDLIIDAAGIHSSVRSNLPKSYNIPANYERGEVFHTYRAYYDFINEANKIQNANIKNEDGSWRFKTYFGFQNIRGIAWYRITENQSDILFGKIDPYNDGEIEHLIEKLRKDNPTLGHKLKSGGFVADIPIRRAFEIFVGDNYAAVGDSASMTIPLTGSGIENSFRAGKMLAKIVQNIYQNNNLSQNSKSDVENPVTKYPIEDLWQYEYEYIKEIGSEMVGIQYLKDYMLTLPWEELDFLFEKQLIKAQDFESAMSGEEVNLSVFDLFGRIIRGFSKIGTLLNLKSATDGVKKAQKTAHSIPKHYDAEKIKDWGKNICDLFIPFKEKLKKL